jgi:HAD superfamily hydrolase (TIGR01484 family)
MRPALIAVDLDGTFLRDDKTIPEVNQAAVRRAAELGIPVVVATGRPPRWLDAIEGLRDLHPVIVTSNGAALYDFHTRELVAAHTIDTPLVFSTVSAIRAAIPGITFGLENSFNFGCEPDCLIQRVGEWEAWPGSLEEIVAACSPVIKVLGFHAEYDSDELMALAEAAIGETLSVTHASIDEPFGVVELAARGVTKATGLAELCAMLGVSAEQVAVFGDMPNDSPMLAWAGMPFAMANSHPEVLAQGFPVASDNNAGGVGRKILELLDG